MISVLSMFTNLFYCPHQDNNASPKTRMNAMAPLTLIDGNVFSILVSCQRKCSPRMKRTKSSSMHILGRFFQRTDGNYLYLHLFTLLGIMNSSTSTIIIYLNRSMLDITQSCRANRCVYKATHWCKRVPFIDSENKESFIKILNFHYMSY